MDISIFKISIIGIVGAVLAVMLKEQRRDFAVQVSILTGIAIFLLVADIFGTSLIAMIKILDKTNVDFVYFDVVLKIIGVSYVAKFASEVCKDAGEGAIAMKIELGAKVIIVALSLPVINSLLQLIVGIMPG